MVDAMQTESGWQAQCRCGWRSDYGTESDMELARSAHRETAHGIMDERVVTTANTSATITVTTPQPWNESDWVSSDEAARILGVTINNLRQFVFKKKLVVVHREGRKAFYSRYDVQRLADSRTAARRSTV